MKKETIQELAKQVLIIFIRLYQYSFSILFGPCCRFNPSCSYYALQSVRRFGIMWGSWLIFKRLIKCHPFHPGGNDPVPEIIKKS